jgi:hypothetical protein
MKKFVLVFALFLLIFGFAFLVGCSCGGGSDSETLAPEQDDDDDAGPADDDTDDDTPDDDDTTDDDDSGLDIDMDVEIIAGGHTGEKGYDIAYAPNGDIVIAAIRGRELAVFTYSGSKAATEQHVTHFASDPALFIDSGGSLHLSFKNLKENTISYANNKSGSWAMEDIETLGSDEETLQSVSSIGIDGSGKVHISYFSTVDDDLQYLTNKSGQWVQEQIEQKAFCGEDNHLGVDSSGHVHVVYDCEGVRYATNESGTWAHEEISSEFGVVGFCSMTMDDNDVLHVAYSETYDGRVYYATRISGSWASEPIGLGADYNYETDPPDIAIDADGFAHVAIWEEGYALFYATNKTGTWVVEEMAGTEVGVRPRIGADSAGSVHMVYHDYEPINDKDLVYLTNAAKAWEEEPVDSPGSAGSHCSMAMDSSDKIHTIFLNESLSQITYGTNKGGGWSLEEVAMVEREMETPVSLPIALDGKGQPHTAYTNDSDELIHAWREAKGWSYETVVADVGLTGGHPSVAIDGSGKAHIAYYSGGMNLNYATNGSGDWETITLITGTDMGRYPKIALSGGNKVHILCYNQGDKRFAYATNETGSWFDEGFLQNGKGKPYLDLHIEKNKDGYYLSFYGGKYLQYYTGSPGSWDTEYITLDIEVAFPSTDIDPAGFPHVVFFEGEADDYSYSSSSGVEDLVYATKADGWWEKRRIDWAGSVGLWATMELDDSGYAHVVYFGEGTLYYGTFEHGYPGW